MPASLSNNTIHLQPNFDYTAYEWEVGDIIGRVKVSIGGGSPAWYILLVTETGYNFEARADVGNGHYLELQIRNGSILLSGETVRDATVEAIMLKFDGSLNG